jgi:hypothetical protein
MATAQDTARARASEPFWLINEPQLPPDPAQIQHAHLMRMAGASLAMSVIRNLLRHSERARRKGATDRPADAAPWALSPTQVQGLRAALYFLRLHSDALLQAERDG